MVQRSCKCNHPLCARCFPRVGIVVESGPAREAGLPNDSKARKDCPVYSGVLAYFPDAIAEVARLSKVGNDKHNPGEPLHWERSKSQDHDDCITRHQLNIAKGELIDPSYPGQNIRHRAAIAWRALAALQLEIECDTVNGSHKEAK